VAAFSPLVAQALAVNGWYRVRAATPDTVELFRGVTRTVGEMLRRPVVSYVDGDHIVITFGLEEDPGVLRTGSGTVL
jgi:hypothetical protein